MGAPGAPFGELESTTGAITPIEFSLARAARLNPALPGLVLSFLLWN